MTHPGDLAAPDARLLIRNGHWTAPTVALARGYVQANLVVVERSLADSFERLCELNPQPLPLLERLAEGSPFPEICAHGADLRTDIPKYRIYTSGRDIREVADLLDEWQAGWCAFLLGCSFTFDALLAEAGIPVRHLEQACNVPMYDTHRALRPSGPFSGNLVVSMRPIPELDVPRVIELTRPLTMAHGAPIHIGSPEQLGIHDLGLPDYGDAVVVQDGEIPVFWACGVTSQAVARASVIPLMVTHSPGYMFITDWCISDVKNPVT